MALAVDMAWEAGALECLLLRPGLEDALGRFLADLAANGDDAFFHPHGGDQATLRSLANDPGRDVHLLMVHLGDVVAYGLLRGWNEGFEVPSLGIAVHPSSRRHGVGRLMMEHLETIARLRGATVIRLRVRSDNHDARRVYEHRGYSFTASKESSGLLVGLKDLGVGAQ